MPKTHASKSPSGAVTRPMRLAALALLTAGACAAWAQPAVDATTVEGLTAAAQKALEHNPEVTASFNAFRAADEGVSAARGGWYPRVDLEAGVSRTRDRITSRNPANQSLTHNGIAIGVRQLLWDGMTTSREVGRLGHEKLARYFQFRDVSEQTALEVGRAWYDVVRYRKMVALAEDNYVQHRYAYSQIESRVRAGVGRGVDLEQSAARLALAESNLTAEVSNLHDVSARYLRVVGEAPPAAMAQPTPMTTGLPAGAAETIGLAVDQSPAVSASIESLRAARESVASYRGTLQPLVEARLRSGAGRHFDGVQDQRRDTTAEITLNWNLYKGGTDQALIRQHVNLLNQAADLRDKACRDARQTAAIAFNDGRRLVDQLAYLDRNVTAILRARDAYRQQFDIGQRSLLDLLNAENELYTARRAYANADFDLGIARMRTQAALGRLTGHLGLRPLDAGDRASEADSWSAGDDAPGRCPVEVLEVTATPLSELDARAQRMVADAPRPAGAPAVRPPAAPASAPPR